MGKKKNKRTKRIRKVPLYSDIAYDDAFKTMETE